MVSEPGVKTIHFSANLVCLSDGSPLSVAQRPQLDCIGCVYSTLDYETNAWFPYIKMSSGERVGTGCRPVPSLLSQASELFGVGLHDGWIKQALPLDETKCAVSLFHKYMRGGSKGLPFAFGILDYAGRVVGRLDGIDDYNESPYSEHHHTLAVDRRYRRIVYKNKAAFFLFDFDGRVLAKVALDNADVKAMAAFHLGCCGADGQIVLYHRKQHLVLQMDPIAQPVDLESAIAIAMTDYNAQRSKLKKQHAPESYRWLAPAPAVRH